MSCFSRQWACTSPVIRSSMQSGLARHFVQVRSTLSTGQVYRPPLLRSEWKAQRGANGFLCRCSTTDTAGTSGKERVLQRPDIDDLASRARLALTSEEKKELTESLEKVVDWFSQLQEIDVDGVPPLLRIQDDELPGELRPDTVADFPEREAMLAQAPSMQGPYLKVPKVLANTSEG